MAGRVEYRTKLHGYYKYFVINRTELTSQIIRGYNLLQKAKDAAKKLAKNKKASRYWVVELKGRAINWG